MKQSINVIVDSVLILAIGVSAFQWLSTPRRSERGFTMQQPVPLETSTAEMPGREEREPAVQPEQIARLFGWREKAAPVKAEPAAADSIPTGAEEEKPEVISYLRYIGYAVGSPGERTYFVKYADTGKVVPLRADAAHDGWTLIEISEAGILVERDDTLYHIPFEK
jgi:hypothetical protein